MTSKNSVLMLFISLNTIAAQENSNDHWEDNCIYIVNTELSVPTKQQHSPGLSYTLFCLANWQLNWKHEMHLFKLIYKL